MLKRRSERNIKINYEVTDMQHFEQIRNALGEYDAMLLTSEANRFYATGFPASDGAAVVTRGGAYFFTDSRYIEAAENTISGAEVLCVDGNNSYTDRINDVLKKDGVSKLGFEEESVTYAEYQKMEKELHAELFPNQTAVAWQRAVKTEEEYEVMVQAQRIAEKSFNDILGIISTDITEKDLAAELLYRMLKNGADDSSFDSIVVSAENSSMPHGVPSDMKIKKGFLTIDFGVKYKGYCSDTTRTLCIGQPTEEMKKIYYTVLDAQKAGIAAAKAGVLGSDIDGAARKVIADAGYGDFFGHGFGHSLGVEIHEFPRASVAANVPIPAGVMISAEPGIYLPGKFGVRIEDVIYITEDGNRDITELDRELIVL